MLRLRGSRYIVGLWSLESREGPGREHRHGECSNGKTAPGKVAVQDANAPASSVKTKSPQSNPFVHMVKLT